MNKTRYMLAREEGLAEGLEKGKAEGKVEGKAEGKAQLLETILTNRFGTLPPESLERLHKLSENQLEQIAVALLSAATLAELGL